MGLGSLLARTVRSPLTILLAAMVFGHLAASSAEAQTRRAFLVGVQRYSDGYINPLTRAVNDAKDLAKDLEDAGFDKKNIKVATDIRTKDAFDKEFDAFLKTVEAGDTVLFFFSGHGFGVEADQNNYLLFTELKSPFTYARSQMNDPERRNADIVRLRIPSFVDSYQRNEIPQSGVAASEIERKLAEKNPKTVIMILDACRSLVKAENDPTEINVAKRTGDSGSRLITGRKPPPGFIVLYSASFGEQALESLTRNDSGRNSLFTEVLRYELLRPGQSLIELADRVKLMVRATAQDFSAQQEPEYVENAPEAFDIALIGTIGRERFRISQDRCAGDRADWNQIKNLRKRELFERHRRRFDGCGTAELARREIAQLALSSDDPIEVPVTAASRAISECDKLAASELDLARPPEVPGVQFEKMDAEGAIAACVKAVADNPRITRYLFNLGRAYHKQGIQPGLDAADKTRVLRSARLAYDDASKRGYVSALNNLAVLYEIGDGVEINQQAAIDLLKRGAEQGHPLAMYNLGIHYRYGVGVRRDWSQAYELFAKSAETGFISSMVELGDALTRGRSVTNPRRGVEWLQRAADAGSTRAKYLLGLTYYYGRIDRRGESSPNTVREDPNLALLWLGRMSDTSDSTAQALLAHLMQTGYGLTSPQPEIAERFWRLAAHGGSAYAQVTFAERLRRGFVLVKQEHGSQEAVDLLERALSQGSAQAALTLAQIKRNGELGLDKSPVEAMKLAYRAIDLAVQSDAFPQPGEPFPEMAAAHLLVEMAKNNEAVDAAGRPLLTLDEIERLERFYGIVDPGTRQVKIRRLTVPLKCGVGQREFDKQKKEWIYEYSWTAPRKLIWVWDWGRSESPTEFQFRNLERETGCTNNELLRRTLNDIFEQSKKNKLAFADLVDQKIKTAQGQQSVEPAVTRDTRRSRRRGRR
jgi:TPR repeat protein